MWDVARQHGERRAGRIGWIDCVRALGACSIVLLHVLVSTALAVEVAGVRAAAYAVVGIVACRWAVPAFFMISGLLLLDPARAVGWGKAWRHAARMLAVLAVFGTGFSLLEEGWVAVRAGAALSVGLVASLVPRALWDVLTLSTWDHLWYVYALAGVYLLVPALRWVQARVGERGFEVLAAALFAGVLVVPTLLRWEMPNLAVGLACFCVGGCLRGRQLSAGVVCAGVASLGAMLAVSLWGVAHGLGDQGFVFLQGSCFASLYAVLVLLLVRRLWGDEPLADGSALAGLARDSFGIYVTHPLFVHLALLALHPLSMPPVVYELGLSAAVLAASVATTRLLRRLPLLRDLL